MEFDFVRDPNCECAGFVDLSNPMNVMNDEVRTKGYYLFGNIHQNDSSKECSCHRKYRFDKRYISKTKNSSLKPLDYVTTFEYVGDKSVYEKLLAIPAIVKNKKVENLIVQVVGKSFSQKTSAVSKLAYNLIQDDQWVVYVDFNKILNDFLDNDFNDSNLRECDWLIIDDCFMSEEVNFKNTVNKLLNIVTKRSKPTVIVSRKHIGEVKGNMYDPDLLQSIEARTQYYKTLLEFNDNYNNIKLKEQGAIDLWSM